MIIRYKLSYDLLPKNLIVDDDLRYSYKNLTKLPDNLIVNGDLWCDHNKLSIFNRKPPKGVKGIFHNK